MSFDSTDLNLSDLLKNVGNGKIRLPDQLDDDELEDGDIEEVT